MSSTGYTDAGGQGVKVASPWRTSPRPSLVVVLVVLGPVLTPSRIAGFATELCCVACWAGRLGATAAAEGGKVANDGGKEGGVTSSSSWAKSCHEIRPHESRFELRPFSAAGKGRVWCSTCGCWRRRSVCFCDSTYSSASSTLSNRIWRPTPCCSSLVHPSDTEEAAVEALAMLHRCESRREEAADEAEEEEKEVAVDRVE
jgi:hypothetical protein